MYDIPNALRRRAMADRLEALQRALESTQQAVEMSTKGPQARHVAETPPEAHAGTATSEAFSWLDDGRTERDDARPPAAVTLPPPPAAPPLPATGYANVTRLPRDVGLAAQERTPDQPARPDVPAARRELTDPLPSWTDESEIPDEPPRGGSSASTIADLIRHGSTALFFDRNG